MTTTSTTTKPSHGDSTNYVRAWRQREAAQGKRSVTVSLPKEAYEKLQDIRKETGKTYSDIIGGVLSGTGDTTTTTEQSPPIPTEWTQEDIDYLKRYMKWRSDSRNNYGLEIVSMAVSPQTKARLRNERKRNQESYGQVVERLLEGVAYGDY